MKASILDLRRRMREVLRALARRELVTVLYRGREAGVIHPAGADVERAGAAAEHSAFGMWADRRDLEDVAEAVRRIRRGRTRAV